MIFSAYTKYIFALVALAVAMLLISYLQPTACHAENYTLALLLTYLGISNLHDEFYILNYPAAADGHISSVTPINNAAQIQITYNIGNAFFVARMDRPVSDIDKYSIDSPVKLIYHSKKPFIAKTDSSKKYYIISVITLLFALMFSAFMIFEALM